MAWTQLTQANATAGNAILASDHAQVFENLNILGAAWTSYTPTIAQGATNNIAKTVNYAKYLQFGKTVLVQISVSMTAAGTTSNAISCTLPVNRANSTLLDIGFGDFDDSGTATYAFTARTSSNNAFQMLRNSNDSAQLLGLGVAFAIASGDNFRAFLMYEAE